MTLSTEATKAVVVLSITAGVAVAVAADDVSTRLVDGPDAAGVMSTRTPAARNASGGETALAGDGVVWSWSYTDATYTTAALSMPGHALAAGTYLNPPMQAEVHDVDGTGEPAWMQAGTRFVIAAARDADVIAGIDVVGQTLTLYKWHAGSSEADWFHVIEEATLASKRTLVVSPDGSTIAVLVTNQGGEEINARLVLFDAGSNVPLATIDADAGTFGRNVSIGGDGAFIAFIAAATIYVVDRDAKTLRTSFSAGGSNDPVAISTDGERVAYGWTTMFMRVWNGGSYTLDWFEAGGGRTLRTCDFSSDGSTFAATWTPGSLDQNEIKLFDPAVSDPLWTYRYEEGGGAYQDVVSDVALTADGRYIAVASWGDQLNTNHEVHVFARAGGDPLLTVDTPGSMFDVDIARDAGGVIRVAAGGKHVHANQSGRGGDLYSIRLQTACTADVDGDGVVAFSDLLDLLAVWGPYEPCPPHRVEDIDQDCAVGFSDVLAVLAAWGPCP